MLPVASKRLTDPEAKPRKEIPRQVLVGLKYLSNRLQLDSMTLPKLDFLQQALHPQTP
jgi:hypothetical protein